MNDTVDILVAGASYSGLALALAVDKAAAGDVSIAVAGLGIERLGDPGSPRAFALSASSKALLEALEVWPLVACDAQAVETIDLTDTPLEAGVRPVLLTYDNLLEDGTPASYIVPSGALGAALIQRLREAGSIRLVGHEITGFAASEATVDANLSNGGRVTAALLVCAAGGSAELRQQAGLSSIAWGHDQTGIVTTVHHERPHHGKAVQHFLPGGPFAILPLTGNRSCITWSEQSDEAQRILNLDDDGFLDEIDRRFGGRLGALELCSERGGFALTTTLARRYVALRFVLIGDAAHRVHPIAGQGLNLAFRDVAALTECLVEGARVGLDIGDFVLLERYERWRRFDSAMSAGTFDAINRLFRVDWPLARAVREVGLGLIDRLPGAKALLVSEAAGRTGNVPKLLKGEMV